MCQKAGLWLCSAACAGSARAVLLHEMAQHASYTVQLKLTLLLLLLLVRQVMLRLLLS